MHELIHRTRRALAHDLAVAARQLDADVARWQVWGTRFGRWFGEWFDAAALRVESVHPVLLHPLRAARVARTLAVSILALTLCSGVAFAHLAQPRGTVQLEHLAGAPAPARQQALLADQPAGAAQPAAAAGPVAATGGAGPAIAAAAAPPPAPKTIPASRGALPVGKGMWIWQPEKTENNDAAAVVNRAKATGLTHLYVRTGTLKGGFVAGEYLNRLLPLAHAAGLRVYGWDFPYLNDIDGDVNRAAAAITYLTPDGHRLDGFSADIELRSMGVNINNITAFVYGEKLRAVVGRDYPLIATVPRPSPALVNYPFAEVAAHFDALSPMVYWMANDPVATVRDTIAQLAKYERPIIPVGQAYDGAGEGGPVGVPARDQLLAFMTAADQAGAPGVSWWSWQHADQQAWDAVRDAPEFRLPAGDAAGFTAGQVRAYQTLLHSLGFFNAPVTGAWDAPTAAAVSEYQRAARLPITGVVDEATRDTLLTPFAPPIHAIA